MFFLNDDFHERFLLSNRVKVCNCGGVSSLKDTDTDIDLCFSSELISLKLFDLLFALHRLQYGHFELARLEFLSTSLNI